MDLIDKHFRLQEEVKTIERENESRKLLIRLAVLRVLSLRAPEKSKGTKLETPPSLAGSVPADATKKLHDYELRISVLKLQLSTKEKVHEAQVDELKDLIALLQKQIDENATSVPARRNVSNPVSLWSKTSLISPPTSSGRSISLGSRLLSPSKSVFNTALPVFKRLKVFNVKGNSFNDLGIESIASSASLKLSQTNSAKTNGAYFSSPNSSVENSPVKKTSPTPVGEGADFDGPANVELEMPGPDANSTNLSLSEPDETFLSANGTLTDDAGQKKKKKIQLLSTSASKVLLEPQGKGLDVEDEDLNSLNYYNDDNFQEDNSSPIRPTKRKLEGGEQPPKKRHVFKI